MRFIRIAPALAFLTIVFSGCMAGPIQPLKSAQSPAVRTPLPAATASPAPSATPAAAPSAKPAATAASSPFNEDNFTQAFQFGMSGEDVKKKLKDLKINILDENMAVYDCAHGSGFQVITAELAKDTDTVSFYMDNKDRLYMMSGVCGTAKGLQRGDSLDRMHALYGPENEIDEVQYQCLTRDFIYYRNGYLFSVNTSANPQRTDYTVDGWSVFVDIWNDPGYFGAAQPQEFHGDDPIRFTEDNFTQYFHLGMTRKAVTAMLTSLGVRITNERDTAEKADNWFVYTDHVGFYFDTHNKLYAICVKGWDTAKGLQEGETMDRLRALYGKESKIYGVRNEYIYQKKGYKFAVFFDTLKAVDIWSVSTRE